MSTFLHGSPWRAIFRYLRLTQTTASKQAGSTLLQQPLDILFELLRFLPSESAVALSLTCKAAFDTLFLVAKHNLNDSSLTELLCLLEGDLSRRFFHCHFCNRLHRFSPSWSPSCPELQCGPKVNSFGKLCFNFNYVYLVMNRHYFGHGHGLSLSQLERTIPPFWEGWHIKSSAMVIKGQLFVCVLHTLELHGDRQQNRRALDHWYDHHICHHITTHPPLISPSERDIRPRRIEELDPWGSSGSFSDAKECVDIGGFCLVCLTDFMTAIQRRDDSPGGLAGEFWSIKVVSYHQLGTCRSPDDWKWQTLTARQPSTSITRQRYLHSSHEPGAVKERWDVHLRTVASAKTKFSTFAASLFPSSHA